MKILFRIIYFSSQLYRSIYILYFKDQWNVLVDISLVVVSGEGLVVASTRWSLCWWEKVCSSPVSGVSGVLSSMTGASSQQCVWPCYLHCHLCLVCLLPAARLAQVRTGFQHNNLQSRPNSDKFIFSLTSNISNRNLSSTYFKMITIVISIISQ